MSTFIIYLKLGYRHILDLYGIEHMLFIIALVAIYLLRDWKKVLFLFSFYLVGHTISLNLSAFRILNPDPQIISYLVPLTIFIAAAGNLFRGEKSTITTRPTKFIFAAVFGIIQGFGLANYFTFIIDVNRKITLPVIAFNIGIELGYLLVIFLYLFITWIFVSNFGVSKRVWYLVISSAIAGIALTFMYETRYWIQ
ncbi:MAG: HupE/UreJ family protein [Cyclobacteriaceae bacterium]|nr:HupE/UreJ family protein [Cyclobacteriaceae bacterium]